MSEIIRPPIEMEVGGVSHTFEYGLTEVHAYRLEVDQPFNHVEAIEFGTQKAYIFDCLDLCMFLAGQELVGHNMKKKQLADHLTAMDSAVGWEATFIVKDEAPEEIKERYVKVATVALKKEVLVVPKSWE